MCDWGIQCVSGDSLVAGAVADPNQDTDYPVTGWLGRGRELVLSETLATQGSPVVARLDRDLHVMRKMDRSALVFSISNVSIEGLGFDVRMVGIIRCLYKMP